MIIGQAAGVAAKMAIQAGVPVQEIDTATLNRNLVRQGAVMEYCPGAPQPTYKGFKQEIGK